MTGILGNLCNVIGEAAGTVCGIAVTPIALTLGVSEKIVVKDINSGCTTIEEIKDFIDSL